MFSTLKLFSNISCPLLDGCTLLNCIFNHETKPARKLQKKPKPNAVIEEPPLKRQKIDQDGTSKAITEAPSPSKTKDISPPPTSRPVGTKDGIKPVDKSTASSTPAKPTPVKTEFLNPRKIDKPPATHAVRLQLLTLLHEQLVRLNGLVNVSDENDAHKHALLLSEQELIGQALDEEIAAAKGSQSVYTNVLKNRIMVLKKMAFPEWKALRLSQIAEQNAESQTTPKKKKKTKQFSGLDPAEEIQLLPLLVTKLDGLEKHGYVLSPPTGEEVESAKKGLKAALGWEVCDRCKSRFQVFPGRRSDGALTSGGQCTYHWGKPRRGPKDVELSIGSGERYTCCNEEVGMPGCTSAECHVFKVSAPAGLAAVMQFECTPTPASTTRKGVKNAVGFDCEMGYTTHGMELIRLTAVNWPDGATLLDVLVRPTGEVLDLNTRFSGVTTDMLLNTPAYSPTINPETLTIVDSPHVARSLFFKLITPSTPLIGHALENDLNALRIVHPVIIDTVLLYPHAAGLPMRHGLKMLVKKHLDRNIQTGGDAGHDSKEDALAAGDLVRLSVAERWRKMKEEGWRVEDGVFVAPA